MFALYVNLNSLKVAGAARKPTGKSTAWKMQVMELGSYKAKSF